MNARALNALAGVICRAQEKSRTPMGIAIAVEAAGMLQSPETPAEMERLTAVAEREHKAFIDSHSALNLVVQDAQRLAAEKGVEELVAERNRLRERVEKLEAQRERRRIRLVALQNDALNMRGVLSPNGFPRRVPMPLGETLTPVVEWLLARVAELEAAATAELTVYHAWHEDDGLPLGLYANEDAAKAHCDDLLRRENTGRTWDWAPDEDGDLVQVFVSKLTDVPEETTGYIVTAVTVAAEYVPEVDE